MNRLLSTTCALVGVGMLGFSAAAQPNIRQGDVGNLAADLAISGEAAGTQTGASIATGDVNGDGIDDLIYGVPFANPNQLNFAGEVHVYFGQRQRPGQERRQIVKFSSLPDVLISGENASDRLGTSVATGDINGDGIDDVIMGAGGYTPPSRSRAGSVFVLFGRANWPGFYVLQAQRADVQVIGNTFTDKLGGHKTHSPPTYSAQSVAACDLNGDGIDDLVCGAPDANYNVNNLNRNRAGAAYVFWGQRNWPAATKLDLAITSASVTCYASHNFAHLGASFAAGDFNGDGIEDLAIGEPEGNAPGGAAAGITHVVYGRPNFPPNHVMDFGFNAQADLTIRGDNQWDQSGYSLDAGDVNADGISDLLVSGWRADPGLPARDLAGGAYLFYGSTTRPPNAVIDLNSTLADVNFQGAAQNDWLSYRVRITDFDGDGFDDCCMSAPSASPNFRTNAGMTFIVRGGRVLPPFFILDFALPGTADWVIWGDTAQEYLGQTMAAGDFNGDGIGDLVQGGDITAFGNAGGLTGRVVVTYGGPLWTTSAPQVGTTMGLAMKFANQGGKTYVCAAAGSDRVGVPLGAAGRIPLDIDPFFLLSAFFPGNGVFFNFSGVLDATGAGSASVQLPNLPGLIGTTLYYSGIVLDPAAPNGVAAIANRVHTTIV